MARSRTARFQNFVRTNKLVILTLVGVSLGLTIGFNLRCAKPDQTTIMWLGLAGELYLRILKMMIVPLIVTSLISVTSSMDPKSNGKISAVCLGYIMLTNFVPSILGLALCVGLHPGSGIYDSGKSEGKVHHILQTQDIFADLLRNLFPDHLITATFEQTKTKYEDRKLNMGLISTSYNDSQINKTLVMDVEKDTKYLGTVQSPNITGLVLICSLFGIACGKLKRIGEPFQKFFSSTSEVVLLALRWIMSMTPLGVASLVLVTIVKADDIGGDFRKLGLYIVTIMLGLCLCSLILMPLAYVAICRKNPFRFLLSIMHPIMIAFATASTPVTMPEMIKCLEDKNNVHKRVSRFVVPFSVTLGRCGTSLYITVSSIFIMQTARVSLSFPNLVLVCILTSLSAMAIPAVHSSSLMTVIMVISTLNIPAEAVSMLYAVDWLIDRCRSVTNLIFQAFGAVVTQHFCRSWLSRIPDSPALSDSEVLAPLDETHANSDVIIEITKTNNERFDTNI